ncbi:MAG TPA: GGDEF domain-containing protein [Terracidiphilus sp.]|jgi:diguanylate cyclase (GGDEF)-like protein|nr:GGDEF domain-containing protein [Terracidiphilus sp.]
MISLKKYLDMNSQGAALEETEPEAISPAALDSYRTLLCSIGKTAVQISPVLGSDLESNLQRLDHRVAFQPTPESVKQIEKQVELQLQEWGGRLSDHLKSKAEEVREIMVALAKTAEAVGNRDQGHSTRFKEVTGQLERIAHLDDLTQLRSSLVKQVSALKNSVEQMSRDNHEMVAQLRAEVSIYETKLRTVEQLSMRDELTRVANRRNIEERIRWSIESKQTFCVLMLDLNGFKQVNDQYGHPAGDDLLKQFAIELQTNTRSGDLVGRWGGDEFVIVLACDLTGAAAHIDRIRHWVFGKYTLQIGKSAENPVVQVDASIGTAEWKSGKSLQDLVAEADASMYKDKGVSRKPR